MDQFRQLAESIPQLAWIARPDGHIAWYNQRWYDYTGATPEQMEGWGWQSVHDPEMLPRVMERWKASIESGEPFDMEFPLRGADGEYRWFLTRVQPVRNEDGSVRGWFGTNTDVDERRRTEQFLEEARRQAEDANRAKTTFLAHMSHELRTPINAIMGYAQLMEMGIPGEPTEAQRVQLGRIMQSGQHLLSLVNEILDLTRIEADALEVRRDEVSLVAVLEQTLPVVRPAADARGVRIVGAAEVDRDLIAEADEDRTRQILVNLLSNAVRHAAENGVVRLRARRAELEEAPPGHAEGGLWVRLDVEDDGAGIAPEHHERIFEPFFQVESGLTRRTGGTGLGLTISRKLARAMGGEVTLASESGRGSTFTLWLPAA